MQNREVVIVGAGPAGLSAANYLKKEGVPFLLVDDAERPGGAFWRMHESMRLISPRRLSQLPGMPFLGRSEYPTAVETADYFLRYFEKQKFDAVFGWKVARLTRKGDDAFELESEDGNLIQARAVVAATGLFSNPWTPDIQGLKSCSWLHASRYRSPAPYEKKRVLVVGAGNTGVEIALELSRNAAVALSAKTPLPLRTKNKTRLGIDKHYFSRPVQGMKIETARRLGIPTGAPTFENGISEAARSGRIELRGELIKIEGGATAIFAESGPFEFDAAILATGYRPALNWIAPAANPAGDRPPNEQGRVSEAPGLFLLGLPALRTVSSEFIRGMPADARRSVRQIRGLLRK